VQKRHAGQAERILDVSGDENTFTVVANCIITDITGFAKRCDTTVVNVLVIEY
jgi:hypothetical protein